MLTEIESLVKAVAGFVWGQPMIILLFGTHIYLSIKLRFIQIRTLPLAIKMIFRKSDDDGDISPFSALMTALAATVGMGNIVGVATAIVIGGPGAVFWMWLTGFLGMATKYSEALLAVKYRQKGETGMQGGPMYYLTHGLGKRWLGCFFAIFTVFATFGAGNMVQANATATIFNSTFGIPNAWTGIVLAFFTAIVIIGGVKSVGRFASFFVPFMIIMYIATMLVVLGLNVEKIPAAFGMIITDAFSGTAATGGFIGASLAAAIRFGVARGLFSNEAGLGSAAIAAASAKTKDPVSQALVSMTGTFIDTIVVCTMTALVILTSDVWMAEGINAASLTSMSVEATLGYGGAIVIAVATGFFAFSTLIGWGFYGEKALEFLLGTKAVIYYRLVTVALVFVGSIMSLGLVWNFSDIMFAMMAIPNLIGLIFLTKVIKSETNRFFLEDH